MTTPRLLKGTTLNAIPKEQTDFLKGIAILLIVFHNYYKWVAPITGENEFWFKADSVILSLTYLRSDPAQFFNIFFNFLGFYGVQLFMVISAYGLTRSWMQRPTGYGRFVLHRFDKLYPSFFFAAFLFVVLTIVRTVRMPAPEFMKDILIQLALIPSRPQAISGPWWFYSFIFQFYLVFPLMMWIARKAGTKGLAGMVIIGYLVTILLYEPLVKATFNPYTLFIGHMPEFCLGIWLAMREKIRVPYLVTLLALVVLVLGNVYEWAWPFANISAVLLLMQVIQWLWSKRERMRPAVAVISFIGVVSMYLFAIHGLIRNDFFNLANYLSAPWAAFLLAILFVTFSTGISWMMLRTESAFRVWLRKPGKPWMPYLKFFSVFILVTGSVALLYIRNQRTAARLEHEPVEVYSATDGFEDLNAKKSSNADTVIVHSGRQSLYMSPPEYYSSALQADLNKEMAQGLDEAVASVWLYTTDTVAQAHLVFEVIDHKTGRRLEWMSKHLFGDGFPRGRWVRAEYRYPVPVQYRRPGFAFRTYVWQNSPGGFRADDLRLVLNAHR